MTDTPPEFLIACLCAAWCGTCRDYRAGFDALRAPLQAQAATSKPGKP